MQIICVLTLTQTQICLCQRTLPLYVHPSEGLSVLSYMVKKCLRHFKFTSFWRRNFLYGKKRELETQPSFIPLFKKVNLTEALTKRPDLSD